MTTGITARDKKLLYALGIIVIVALFFIIGIRPLNRKIRDTDDKLDDAKIEYDTIKMKLYQLDMLEDFERTAKDTVAELSSRYYDKMFSAEVDKLITNKALGYGLKVNNLSIRTEQEPVTVLAYTHSEAWEAQKKATISRSDTGRSSEQDDTDGNESTGTTFDADMVDIDALASIHQEDGIYSVSDTTPADVYATSIVLDVYGPHDQAQALLDELIQDPSLRVTAFQWTDMTTLPYQYVNGELVQIDQENGNRLVIRFDLYMYDGSNFRAFTEQQDGGEQQ